MSVNSTRSAPYKGMISLIIKNGARDFLAGRNMGTSAKFDEQMISTPSLSIEKIKSSTR